MKHFNLLNTDVGNYLRNQQTIISGRDHFVNVPSQRRLSLAGLIHKMIFDLSAWSRYLVDRFKSHTVSYCVPK